MWLTESLACDKFSEFMFASAFVSRQGVELIGNSLARFKNRGNVIAGVVGVNQGSTSIQGLNLLMEVMEGGLQLCCVLSGGGIFHPKLYCFRSSTDKTIKVVVGSSNLTRGGLERNDECNTLIEDELETSEIGQNISESWNSWSSNRQGIVAIPASKEMVADLYGCGALVDEDSFDVQNHQGGRATSQTEVRLQEVLSKSLSGRKYNLFAMTLSNFDVSSQSQDPVVLIPKLARTKDPKFWYWPDLFVERIDHSDVYVEAQVSVDGEVKERLLRLYDYRRKSEFRLKCADVKRKGNAGDIMLVEREGETMKVALVRSNSKEFAQWAQLLTTRVSEQKIFGYANTLPTA